MQVIPKPLIAIAALRINTLPNIEVVPDEYRLDYKLTFNEKYTRGENARMALAMGRS